MIITGSCLNKRETHYYSYVSNPNMPLKKAVRISMSIPILFNPVVWNDDVLVDGGLLENYCIYIFDKKNINSKECRINETSPTHDKISKTIGIKLLCEDEKPDEQVYHGNYHIESLVDFLSALIETTLTSIDRSYIHKKYWDRTISVYVGNIPITKFDLPKEKKLDLIEFGKKSALEFLEKNENQTH